MSDVIVSGVEMKDDGTRRITTITVTEGRGGDVWPTHPSSIPPAVREKLLGVAGGCAVRRRHGAR